MPKTLVRTTGLVVALLLALGAWLLLRHEGDGWRWLVNGGWHTTARTGALTPEEQRWAAVAWRYFENNSEANSGLVSGSDRRPVVSLWQMGDTLIALTAARELQLIDDRRLTTSSVSCSAASIAFRSPGAACPICSITAGRWRWWATAIRHR